MFSPNAVQVNHERLPQNLNISVCTCTCIKKIVIRIL